MTYAHLQRMSGDHGAWRRATREARPFPWCLHKAVGANWEGNPWAIWVMHLNQGLRK